MEQSKGNIKGRRKVAEKKGNKKLFYMEFGDGTCVG